MDYKSPIEVNLMNNVFNNLQIQMKEHIDECILKAVHGVGVEVDKEELLKALRYDRDQYTQGFQDAKVKYEKALDRACEILAVYNGPPSKENEPILYANCILANDALKWKEVLLEGVYDE